MPVTADYMNMKFRLCRRFVCLFAAGFLGCGMAQAEWAELMKDDDITYAWDKESVRAVHINRYAWTMTNLGKATKAPNGEDYQSSMARWRIQCKTDSFIKRVARPAQGKIRKIQWPDLCIIRNCQRICHHTRCCHLGQSLYADTC